MPEGKGHFGRVRSSENSICRELIWRVWFERVCSNESVTVFTSLADGDFNEAQSWIEVAVKAPKGVLCLLSALTFHDLTTQNPFEVWLAIPRDAHRPKIEFVEARVFRFAPPVYEAGIETHVIGGVEVKV